MDLSHLPQNHFKTILADPPWKFKLTYRDKTIIPYQTISMSEIASLSIDKLTTPTSHLYLWVPNALIKEGIKTLESWGFTYKTNLVWHKILKNGRPDNRGLGHYFRNCTELILFGVKGKGAQTLKPGRTQINFIASQKREHSRKPDELYHLIEQCSPGPYLELFARITRPNWTAWGNETNKF